jgi:hypothetical protein
LFDPKVHHGLRDARAIEGGKLRRRTGARATSSEQRSDHDLAIGGLRQPAEAGAERDVQDRAVRGGSQDRFRSRAQARSPDPREKPKKRISRAVTAWTAAKTRSGGAAIRIS